MKRLATIGGAPVAVHCTPGDARDLVTRQLRRAAPFDARPVQWHAWAPGYGSAFGDTIEEACDALAAAYDLVAPAPVPDPAARPGWLSPAERVVALDRRHRPDHSRDRFVVSHRPGTSGMATSDWPRAAAALVTAALG